MAKLLVVDDSNTVLAYLTTVLTADGHEVFATSCGQSAVAHLEAAPVDLVLTDLYMPAPDGFEVMRRAQACGRPTPVIAMSTNPHECNVLRAARVLGAAATLQKPFTTESLRVAVNAVLARTATTPPLDRSAPTRA